MGGEAMEQEFKQLENINYIKNTLGKGLWIQVYGSRNMYGADACFWAGLIPNDNIKEVLKTTDWEHKIGCKGPGFVQYGNDEIVYDRYCDSEYEPLLYLRDYFGIKEPHIEISEEFRLLNNLYYNDIEKKYYEINENGDLNPIIKIEGGNVYIKLSHLKRFAAVKQAGIALYFDIMFNSTKTHKEMNIEPLRDSSSGQDYCFDIYSSDDEMLHQGRKAYSIINGKKILSAVDIEQCGYWPFEREEQFEDFIIGSDENGEHIKFNANPQNLSSYHRDNPDQPDYLTPVYFSKDVLTKYYSKPELYEINDGILRCQGLWSLQMDNLGKDYISVYLGDLGKSLSIKEQVYWKSFNIIPDGKISETKYKRDFLAEFADPEIADLKFKYIFNEFRGKWNNHFGWDLFLQLSKEDKYNLEHLRIPISASQVEFDSLVLSLVKTIIDSLNERKLYKLLSNTDSITGSISRLERYFEEQEITEYESHIRFLRDLQNLRSSGSGHRKGKSYQKSSEKFQLKDGNFVQVFENILISAINFIEFLEEKFIK